MTALNYSFNKQLSPNILFVYRGSSPRETWCTDVGGCRISEVNKGDMESQGLYLSIFISHTSTARDQNKKKENKKRRRKKKKKNTKKKQTKRSSLYLTIWIWNALIHFELCPKDGEPLSKWEFHSFQRTFRSRLLIFEFVLPFALSVGTVAIEHLSVAYIRSVG